MANELTLQTNEKPTLINKDMAIGALLIPTLLGGGLVSLAVGGFVGAFIGKKQMEHEERAGKKVSETPKAFNKDMILGGLTGAAIAQVAAGALITAGAVLSTPLLIAATAAVVGTAAVGAFIGSKVGQKHQADDYNKAKQQTIVRHISQTVSPEVGGAVEYAMIHNKSWAQDVTEKRLLEQAQQQGIS